MLLIDVSVITAILQCDVW